MDMRVDASNPEEKQVEGHRSSLSLGKVAAVVVGVVVLVWLAFTVNGMRNRADVIEAVRSSPTTVGLAVGSCNQNPRVEELEQTEPGTYEVLIRTELSGNGLDCLDQVTISVDPTHDSVVIIDRTSGESFTAIKPEGQSARPDANPPFDGPSVDGPLILSFPRSDSEGALILGVVEVEDDGCVTVDGNVAVWPPGTTWDETRESIILPDGSVAASGDAVEGGGGYQPPSNLSFFVTDEGAEAVLTCITDRSDEIAVFNSQTDSVTRG